MAGKKHFTKKERLQLKHLLDQGITVSNIALQMGKGERTIYYEIRKGKDENGIYDPQREQDIAEKTAQKGTAGKLETNRSLAEKISHMILDEHMNPEEISMQLDNMGEHLAIGTIYSSIDAGLIPGVSWDSYCRSRIIRVFKGAVTIPQYIRQKCRIKDGDEYVVDSFDQDTIVLRRKDTVKQKAEPTYNEKRVKIGVVAPYGRKRRKRTDKDHAAVFQDQRRC